MAEFDEQKYLARRESLREALEAARANPIETRAARLFLWRHLGDPSDLPIPDEDLIEDPEEARAAGQTIADFIGEQGPAFQQSYAEADFWIRWCLTGYESFVREEFPHGSWPGLILAAIEGATYQLGGLAALGQADLERSDIDDDDRARIESLLSEIVAMARRVFKDARVIRDLTGTGWSP